MDERKIGMQLPFEDRLPDDVKYTVTLQENWGDKSVLKLVADVSKDKLIEVLDAVIPRHYVGFYMRFVMQSEKVHSG